MKTAPLGELIAAAQSRRAGGADLPVLSMTMHEGLVDQSAKFKKRVASADTSDYKVVSRGQLVVGFPIDEGVLDFQSTYPEGIVSPAYGVWDLKDETSTDRNYLRRFLRSPKALGYYKAKLRGSTARRRSLPASLFLELPVPYPSVDAQRRIAAILGQADSLREMRRKALSTLDSLEQAAFLESFGPPATWASRWAMGTIGEMADDVQYGTASKAGEDGAWPIIRMGNVTDSGRLDLTDLKWIDLSGSEAARFTVRRGDLLFNRTNSREKVGKTCVIETDEPLAFAGYLVRVRLKPDHQPAFVNAYMTSSYGRALRFGMAKSAVNQANINATEMRSIPIALPPAALQKEFAEQVAKIRSEREKQQRGAAELDDLFLSVQYRAFSGQL